MLTLGPVPAWLFIVMVALLLWPWAIVVHLFPKEENATIDNQDHPRRSAFLATMAILSILFFAAELMVLGTVLAHRHDWQSVHVLTTHLSFALDDYVPALERLPRQLVEVGAAKRIPMIRDAATIGYLFGFLIAGIIVFDPRSVVSKAVEFGKAQNRRRRSGHWATIATFFIFPMMAITIFFEYPVQSMERYDDVFGNILDSDVAVAYDMWIAPFLVFSLAAGIFRLFIFKITSLTR